MKSVLILMTIFSVSAQALANDDTVKLCIDMLTQKQAQASAENKLQSKQINTYCECIIPKLEQIKAGKAPTNKELNVLYTECQDKAGIKLTR